MDMLTFIVNVISVSAWPVVAAFVVWIIREPLADFIRTIKSVDVKYKDITLEVKNGLGEVSASLESGNEEDIKTAKEKVDNMLKQLETDATVYKNIITRAYNDGLKSKNY